MTKPSRFVRLLSLAFALGFSPLCFAEESAPIEDNSFLIEEAYNQDRGIVQFIQTFEFDTKAKTYEYSFTNEIPTPDRFHQLSYTLYVNKPSSEGDAGFGDLLLNYRYQLLNHENLLMAPRVSVILPTGSAEEGTGTGGFGLQFNHTLTVELRKHWMNHWNLGFTRTFGASAPGGGSADLLSLNAGTSFIYQWSDRFNLMLELLWEREESAAAAQSVVSSDSLRVLPGFRYAFNLESGTQIVPGFALPVGVGPSSGDLGVFVYLSIEPKLW